MLRVASGKANDRRYREEFSLDLLSNSKWARYTSFFNEVVARIDSPSGPFLVSRIGDAGCTESRDLWYLSICLSDPRKGVGSSRQQDCDHGS